MKALHGHSSVKGFTMAELAVGLALVAIVITLAVPSFRIMTQDSKISAATNELVAHLNRARSEAISRNVPINLCRTTGINLASPEDSTCSGAASKTWTTGWLIYTAPGTTSGLDHYQNIAGAELLAFHQGFDNVAIISNGSGNQWLALRADGSLNESGLARYAVCDERSFSAGRLIEISMTGLVKVTNTSAATATDCSPT